MSCLLPLVFPLAAGEARRDLLQQPLVAVRVAERSVGLVRPILRVAPWAPPAGEVEHLADLNATIDEGRAGRVDVVDGQDQTVDRSRLAGGEALAEGDRAGRLGRRDLDNPEVI